MEKIMSLYVKTLLLFAFMIPLAVGELAAKTNYEKATLAGGCFWCMTPPFENLNGVKKVISGYTGGKGTNPTYEDYSQKGYIEAIQVTFDPSIITYERILDVFWRQINPTDSGGQFCDRGSQYRPAIFYASEEQKTLAEQSRAALAKSGRFNKPITTEIIPAAAFYPAEEYHQDYHKKNPLRYKYYRYRCGRDQFLENVWGDTTDVSIQ
jgi:peptide methionine sulfoxide reductase msrA/msrB